MTLRLHRRNLVIWSSSGGPADRGRGVWFTRPGRSGRVRRRLRVTGLLVVVGLLRLAAAVRPRWRLLTAGTVLTVAGVVLRSGMAGAIMIPGMLFLAAALLTPVSPEAASPQRRALERELAAYSTPAQRHDLDAILDRYRDILARHPAPADPNRHPAPGRY
jgi:hypothetical protein